MSDAYLKERIAQLEQELRQTRAREKEVGDLLEKKLNEIYTHYHISRTIGSLPDLQEMLRQVTGIIKKALSFDRISVYLLDEHTERLELVFFSGLNVENKITLQRGKFLLVSFSLFGYIIAVNFFGFVLSTFAFVFFLLYIFKFGRMWLMVMAATLITAGNYVIFEVWLGLNLPKGTLIIW